MRELFFKPASLRNPQFLDGLVRLRHDDGQEDAEEDDDDEADDVDAEDVEDKTDLGEGDDGTGQPAVGLQLCAGCEQPTDIF